MPASRLGILTAGGDCAGLNAVIRGFVCAAAERNLEVVGFNEGYEGLLQPSAGRVLTPANTRGIESTGGSILGATNKGRFQTRRTPGGQFVLPDPLLRAARQTLEQNRVGALVVLGGDGSLRTALHLARAGMPVIGVPKTIENDLESTDVTFGFDTAVNRIAEAVANLRTTAESHRRVLVLEVMGRHSGWLALHGAVAGGAEIALIPELPFDGDRLTKFIKDGERRGQRSLVAVVAEGARAKPDDKSDGRRRLVTAVSVVSALTSSRSSPHAPAAKRDRACSVICNAADPPAPSIVSSVNSSVCARWNWQPTECSDAW